MIAALFHPAVASEVAFGDIPAELPPVEARYMARAVPPRRAEFTTGRVCARRCLDRLGVGAVAIPPDQRGAPRWPTGVVGSITHCRGFRGAAVARTTTHLALGLDSEPDEPLPPGIAHDVARPEERRWLVSGGVHPVHADRLLFSAKESVYKSWYPLTGRWLDFHDVHIEFGDDDFIAYVLVDLSDHEQLLRTIPGRWLAADGLVLTATEITR